MQMRGQRIFGNMIDEQKIQNLNLDLTPMPSSNTSQKQSDGKHQTFTIE